MKDYQNLRYEEFLKVKARYETLKKANLDLHRQQKVYKRLLSNGSEEEWGQAIKKTKEIVAKLSI